MYRSHRHCRTHQSYNTSADPTVLGDSHLIDTSPMVVEITAPLVRVPHSCHRIDQEGDRSNMVKLELASCRQALSVLPRCKAQAAPKQLLPSASC